MATNYSIIKPFSGATTKAKDRKRKRRRPSAFGPLLTGEAGRPASQKKPGFGALAKGSSTGLAKPTSSPMFGQPQLTPPPPAVARPVVRDAFGQPTGQSTIGGIAQNPAVKPTVSPKYVTDKPTDPFSPEVPYEEPGGAVGWRPSDPGYGYQPANPVPNPYPIPIAYPQQPPPGSTRNEEGKFVPDETQSPFSGGGTTSGAGGLTMPVKPGQDLQPWEVGNIGRLGRYWLERILRDPYQLDEGMLRGVDERTNLAFNTAMNRMLADQFGSGAARSGVASGERGNMELARGAQLATNKRQFEEYRQQLGDARLQRLLLPYYQMALQQRAINAGLTPPPSSSSSDWIMPVLGMGFEAFMEWWKERNRNRNSGGGGSNEYVNY